MSGTRVGWRWRVVAGTLTTLILGVGACGRRPLVPATSPTTTNRPAAERPSPAVARDTATTPSPDEAFPLDEAPPSPSLGDGPLVRIALTVHVGSAPLSASGAWRLLDEDGGVIVRANPRDRWSIERRGRVLRAVRPDGLASAWHAGPVTLRTDRVGTVRSGGRAYQIGRAHV